jgi:hypothetical protein
MGASKPRVGPRTPPIKWLDVPIVLDKRAYIVGVAADCADANAVFAELERESATTQEAA